MFMSKCLVRIPLLNEVAKPVGKLKNIFHILHILYIILLNISMNTSAGWGMFAYNHKTIRLRNTCVNTFAYM